MPGPCKQKLKNKIAIGNENEKNKFTIRSLIMQNVAATDRNHHHHQTSESPSSEHR